MSDLQSRLQSRIAQYKTQVDKPEKPDPELAKYAPEPDYEEDAFSSLLNDVDILKAYELWCGKMKPKPRPGQTESIFISCPIPGHVDKDPSAWANTQNNTWFCGRCQQGGDIYDIAAWRFGISDYKNGKNFGKLRQLMAEALGYGVAKIGKKEVPYLKAVPDQQKDEPTPSPSTEHVAQSLGVDPALIKPVGLPSLPTVAGATEDQIESQLAEIVSMEGENGLIFPTLDWRSITTPGTFLDCYMGATTQDDIAEEYHFWNALLALGACVGKDAWLRDSPRVWANLFLCLLGNTGDGKTRSFGYARKVIKEALPFDGAQDYPKGVKFPPNPASGEVLIKHFVHEVIDPNVPKVVRDYAPIRGVVEYDEMAELLGKANRQGNTLKSTLIALYDTRDTVGTSSLTHGSIEARGAFCCMFSSTQPDSLKTILRNNDRTSGFLNRWVFASGKPKPRSFFQEDIVDLNEPTQELKRIAGWIGFGNKEITCTPEAIEIMEDFHRKTLEKQVSSSANPMIARLPLLYKKLLLLLAVNERSMVVTPEIAKKVVSMHDYQLENYDIAGSRVGIDEQTEVFNTVSKLVREMQTKTANGPSNGMLNRRLKPYNYKAQHINAALKMLQDRGMIEIYATEGRGRPTTRYRWVEA